MKIQKQIKSVVVRPAGITHQPCLFLFSLWMLVVATVLPATAQGNETAIKNQTLALPAYGATLQVPAGWSHRHYANVDELLNVTPDKMATMASVDLDRTAKISIEILNLQSHSDAVDRLTIVAAERQAQATFLTIAGWPALQRQAVVPKPQLGEQEAAAESNNEPGKHLLLVTTAVAVGNSVFRLDGTVAAESPTANTIAAQIKEMGLALSFQQSGNAAQAALDVQQLQSNPSPRLKSPQPPQKISTPSNSQSPKTFSAAPENIPASAVPAASQPVGLSFNTAISGSGTEPEIAVSTNGRNIVIASQFNGVSSQNGGQTFSAPFSFPNTSCGDSSLAYGRSGNFYEGSIGTDGLSGCDTQVMDVSTNNGATFVFRSNPIVCNGANCGFVSAARPNGVPDQEHIAADRFNAGPAPAAGDQVYVVWRDKGYGIVCSSDSGNNWTAPVFPAASADFPRVAVGQDGSVYVIYTVGDNIEVDRFSSCANGLTQLKSGAVVAAGTHEVVCPVAGLDRCGGLNGFFRNDLRSPSVVVDDINPSHIYAVYATNTLTDNAGGYPLGNGVNENVVVSDSNDNGNTWSTPIPVNSGINARRYLPWVCSVGGAAYASWFDRRNATPITNDASDFFGGSAAPSGGTLTAQLPDFQINAPNTSDPQCGVPVGGFWPAGPDKSSYSTSCYVTPQLAGTCSVGGARCDFNSPPAGCGTCQTGGGQPKYGDYNGNACAAGRLYNVWGSATAQPFTNPPSNISLFFSQKLVCCEPQIQVPGPISLNACAGSTASAPVNICNTGKADLTVNAITSSNPKITVSPSAGYPLTVSPDFCFPAQVTLTPGSTTGPINGTLTIASNDTVTPSATVQINGSSPTPSINATIVNSGNFGNVCPGGQSSLSLNVTNQSSCNLVVNSITTSPNFLPPTTVSLPLTLTADGTIALPLTFAPGISQACSTAPITGSVTINSNDPSQPLGNTVVGVQGTVPCPKIAATIPNGGKFGNVCSGNVSDLNLEVLNTGACNLNISSITSSSTQFALPGGPLVLSPDANVDLPVAFQPAPYGSPGYVTCSNTVPETSNITIVSNDPTNPIFVTPVQGIEGCPTLVLGPLNLTGLNDYPPTVSDPTGTLGCYTDKQITVSNTGICPLIIPSIATVNGQDGHGLPLPAAPLEYSVVNTPLPITLAPFGKPIPITVRFKPEILTDQNPTAPDQQTGTLKITSNDPVVPDNTAALCGEPVYHSGARVLLVDTLNNPLSSVTTLRLTTKNINPPFLEKLSPAPLQPPANVCGNTIYYHLDNETLNPTGKNPNAFYVVLVNDNPHYFLPVNFRLGQCQFQQIVVPEQY